MRRVYRESLSDDAMARLCERTLQIGAAGLQHAKPAQRIKARKERASDLWKDERTNVPKRKKCPDQLFN